MFNVFGWFVLFLKSDIFVVIVLSDDERQYFSLYQAVSPQKEKEEEKR